jgi:ankyrin repeat protein
MTALGWAARHLNLEMMKALLAAGADPDAADGDRRTARERLPAEPSSARDAALALFAASRKSQPG